MHENRFVKHAWFDNMSLLQRVRLYQIPLNIWFQFYALHTAAVCTTLQ